MVKGRCMKCKKEVEIKDPKEVVMKNKMKAVKGTCPVCGTKVFRIIGKA
jgi:DNA-directed RNA polymerase subunit RPC12/RpoP